MHPSDAFCRSNKKMMTCIHTNSLGGKQTHGASENVDRNTTIF